MISNLILARGSKTANQTGWSAKDSRVNFFASHATVVDIFASQNDTLIKQITGHREKDLHECDKAGER